MFNTTILIIIGIVFTIYAMRTVNGIENDNFHFSDLLVAMLCLAIIIQARLYAPASSVDTNTAYNKGFDLGFDAAVHSAELVEVNDDNYCISFGNEAHQIHEYTFDN